MKKEDCKIVEIDQFSCNLFMLKSNFRIFALPVDEWEDEQAYYSKIGIVTLQELMTLQGQIDNLNTLRKS